MAGCKVTSGKVTSGKVTSGPLVLLDELRLEWNSGRIFPGTDMRDCALVYSISSERPT